MRFQNYIFFQARLKPQCTASGRQHPARSSIKTPWWWHLLTVLPHPHHLVLLHGCALLLCWHSMRWTRDHLFLTRTAQTGYFWLGHLSTASGKARSSRESKEKIWQRPQLQATPKTLRLFHHLTWQGAQDCISGSISQNIVTRSHIVKYWLNGHLFFTLLPGSLPSLTLNIYLSLPQDKWEKQKRNYNNKSYRRHMWRSWSHSHLPEKLTTKAGHVAQTVQLSLEGQQGDPTACLGKQSVYSLAEKPTLQWTCKVSQMNLVKLVAHQDPHSLHWSAAHLPVGPSLHHCRELLQTRGESWYLSLLKFLTGSFSSHKRHKEGWELLGFLGSPRSGKGPRRVFARSWAFLQRPDNHRSSHLQPKWFTLEQGSLRHLWHHHWHSADNGAWGSTYWRFTPLTHAQWVNTTCLHMNSPRPQEKLLQVYILLEIKLKDTVHPPARVKKLVLGQCKVSLCIPGGTGESSRDDLTLVPASRGPLLCKVWQKEKWRIKDTHGFGQCDL